MSDRFARTAAEVLAAHGIPVFLASEISTTPSVSWAVHERQTAGGVVITSSHNPPEWNGFKYKPEYGGSGLPELMTAVENLIPDTFSPNGTHAPITSVSLKVEHQRRLCAMVDVDKIKRSSLRVAVDPMYGAASGNLPELLKGGGCQVTEVCGEFNPGFGGINPEPIARNLHPLADASKKAKAHVGLAFDGDGDRIGAMDADGRFYNSHEIFCMLLWHLVSNRGWTGGVIKTFSTSRMVDKLASHFGLKLYEVPIGFKYIVELMMQEDILIGGEESGGIGIKNHLPERDGLLSGLLLLEALAGPRITVQKFLTQLQQITGSFHYLREDIKVQAHGGRDELMALLKSAVPAKLGGRTVLTTEDLDGLKLCFNGGDWLLLRPSGTEPVVRVYAEAGSHEQMSNLLDEGVRLARKATDKP
jgi:phosphomannomutase